MSMVQLFCAVLLVHVCSALASEKESFSVQNDGKAATCGLDDFQMDTLAKYVHVCRIIRSLLKWKYHQQMATE